MYGAYREHPRQKQILLLKTRKKLTWRWCDKLPTPWSIIRKVDRHAKCDKMISRLVFVNRNKYPYKAVANEEYNEEPEGLVEKEPSPFQRFPQR